MYMGHSSFLLAMSVNSCIFFLSGTVYARSWVECFTKGYITIKKNKELFDSATRSFHCSGSYFTLNSELLHVKEILVVWNGQQAIIHVKNRREGRTICS